MELWIEEARKRNGEIFPFTLRERLTDTDYGTRSLRFVDELTLNGQFRFDGKAFLVEAQAAVSYEAVCARCNRTFTQPLEFALSERFVRQGTALDDDAESYPCEGDHIDLTQAVLDNLFLNLPLVELCKPDCKGLCPVCGCDRNEQSCGCSEGPRNSAFDALLQWQNENKEV